MANHKEYTDVVRLGHASTEGYFKVGDYITITEKIDGANASFMRNEIDGLNTFSRTTRVDEKETLRGFFGWANENIDPTRLIPHYRYFGEWLVGHKVQYHTNMYQNFFMFSIFDEIEQKYLPDAWVREEANRLSILNVPLLYAGPYISYEHLLGFVGQSYMAENHGEGIVIKNHDYLDKWGHQLFVKLVHADFQETTKVKVVKDPNAPLTPEQEFAEFTVTPARVEKLLLKMVDADLIPEHFGIEEMGLILRTIGLDVLDDIVKEEAGTYLPVGFDYKAIKKAVGQKVPSIVKAIIASREVVIL